jgi:3-dehydroquinate synthase
MKFPSGVWPSGSKPKRAFLLVDSMLSRPTRLLVSKLSGFGCKTSVIRLRANEALKDFRNVYPIYGQLLKKGADRQSVIFALGGGVIGDASGFVAATYLRGIPWVAVPTTLLAQVDSAIGGKTGVNHRLGKNLIGAFHQPSLVICDVAFIKTLSQRELLSGLGEMVKYGLIYDDRLYQNLRQDWKSILETRENSIVSYVGKCAELKAKAVESDERDTRGPRALLNFGHTIGHALEGATKYRYFRHGEAVIWGMRFAVVISLLKGFLAEKAAMDIDQFLKSLPVPEIPRDITLRKMLLGIRYDKKNVGGSIRFVLLKRIGEGVSGIKTSGDDIARAYRVIRQGGLG